MKTFFKSLALVCALGSPAAAIDIQAVTSPMGRTAWLTEDHTIPFVSIDVIFAGGASLDPAIHPGAVSLMTALLTEGAGDLDAQGYAAALESLAAGVSFETGRDSVTMSIKALTENRDQVIDLALLALTDAHFSAQSLERVRAQQVAALEREARDASTRASQTFARLGYADHAYARPTDGTPDSVAALTVDLILDAHRAAFTSDLVSIGAAGDITAEELGAIVDHILDNLPASNTPLPEYRSYDAPAGVTVVDHPGGQSVIQFGHAGIRWDDPDFMPAFLMNEMFGGGRFGTRLMDEIREQRGLTYGIYTALASYRWGDAYVGRFTTANETAAEAIDLVRQQFQWLADGGITEADLERVKTYLTGAYPLRFDGNESIARILATMQFQQYDIDYVNVRNDLVRAVTLDDIQRVARRLAQPDTLHFVVVGQPVGLE